MAEATVAASGGSKENHMEPQMMVNRGMTPADVAAVTGNNKINQLQFNEALRGVVRLPNATTCAAGCNPYFANNGCGCNTAF